MMLGNAFLICSDAQFKPYDPVLIDLGGVRCQKISINSYDWEEWEVLFDTYLALQKITVGVEKTSFLITALGVQPFKALISIYKPKKPIDCVL